MMNFKIKHSIFLLSTLLLFSCKKENIEEPIVDESPVFYVDGTLGSENLSMVAGQDNFYMESYSELRNGVKFFAGNLSNSTTELEMGIYNGEIDKLIPTFITVLPDSLKLAFTSSQPLAILSKDMLPNAYLINEIQWFVNGTFAGINSIELTEPGKYSVCATVMFSNGSQANLCNDLIVGYKLGTESQLRHYLDQNGVLQSWIEGQNAEVALIQWYIDGNEAGNEEKLVTNIDNQSHVISADVIFQNGTCRKKSIVVDGSLNGYFVDDFSVFEHQTTTVEQDYNVFIGLKKNGKYYRSDLVNNTNSHVKVNNVSYFGLNAAGNAVFKISADIDCYLKEEGTGEVLPINCSTVFGVEVK